MARLVHAIVALAFVFMAAIQLNDPDPAYWIVVYVVVAAIPSARIFGYRLPKLVLIASGMVLSGLIIATPGTIDYLTSSDFAAIRGKMLGEKPYVESAREFIGLAMAAISLIYYRK